VAAALAALDLLESDPGMIERLHEAARTLRAALTSEGFAVQESDMHIVPLLIGDPTDATRVCEAALQHGVFAQAIRPPTVPARTSRLRLAAMASHTPVQLRDAAKALAQAVRAAGLDPATIGSHAAGESRFAGVA
jgi:glycine C-acetyltransferase/8-amino-7-oxononanoate synthase